MIGRPGDRARQKGQTYSIDFPLASLAPGQYLLEITANGGRPETGRRASVGSCFGSRIERIGSLDRQMSEIHSIRIRNLHAYIPRSFVTVATRLIATM